MNFDPESDAHLIASALAAARNAGAPESEIRRILEQEAEIRDNPFGPPILAARLFALGRGQSPRPPLPPWPGAA